MARTPRADTRRRVLDVALELFMTQGYERTSLREISERLGFTKAALYYHFRAKEDILEALAGDLITRLEELMAAAEARADRSLPARLRLLEELVDLMLSNRGMAELLMNEHRSLVTTPILERAHETMIRTRTLMLPPSPTDEDHIRASAALGILEATVYNLPHVATDTIRRLVISLAYGVLAGGSPDPRED